MYINNNLYAKSLIEDFIRGGIIFQAWTDIIGTIIEKDGKSESKMLTYTSMVDKKSRFSAIAKGEKCIVHGEMYECIEVYHVPEKRIRLYLVK